MIRLHIPLVVAAILFMASIAVAHGGHEQEEESTGENVPQEPIVCILFPVIIDVLVALLRFGKALSVF